MPLFLTDDELSELTGIKRGRHGSSKAQLQSKYLREQGIPFYKNIKGEPKVTRCLLEGGKQQSSNETWQPAVLQKRA